MGLSHGRVWKVLILFGVVLGFNSHPLRKAHGDLIVAYDSSSNLEILTASESGFGVNALGLSRGSGITRDTGTTSTFNSEGFTESSLLAAQTSNDYLQWGWSNGTTPTNLTDLEIRYDRSGTGPNEVAILLAVNGGSFQTIFADANVSDAGEEHLDIDLTSFTNVTSATFQLFAFSATSSVGTFDIENFQSSPARGIAVNGVATPEPGFLTFLGVLGIAAGLYSRLKPKDSGDAAARSHSRSGLP